MLLKQDQSYIDKACKGITRCVAEYVQPWQYRIHYE